MDRDFFRETVVKSFKENIDIRDKILSKMLLYEKYVDLILKWNSKINITGFNEKKFIYNGIVEPLLILKKFYFSGESITDIGAGSGIPSVTFAILFDNIRVTCVEISKKRLSFLNYLKYNLNMDNMNIEKTPPFASDVITSRAFKSFEKFLNFLDIEKIKWKYMLFYFNDKISSNVAPEIVKKYTNPFNGKIYNQAIFRHEKFFSQEN